MADARDTLARLRAIVDEAGRTGLNHAMRLEVCGARRALLDVANAAARLVNASQFNPHAVPLIAGDVQRALAKLGEVKL